MITKLQQPDIIRRWLNILQPGIADRCFGHNMDTLLSVIDCYRLERLPQCAQSLWEFPLLGEAHCDFSFCYDRETMMGNRFLQEEGGRIGSLLWHLFNLTPDVDIWTEIDIPKNRNQLKIPAVFLNVSNDMQIILDRTWVPGSEPPQWAKLKDIWHNLVSGWKMHYIGLMPGRANNPLRLIFKRQEIKGQTEEACLENVQELLENVGYPVLAEDAKNKLRQLEQLGFKEWEISFDLYPDNSFGEILGVETAMVEDGANPFQLTNSDKWQDLQRILLQWGLADERIRDIKGLLGSQDLQFLGEKVRALVYTFMSHIKLRWKGETPLPAKAYLTHNYELH